MIFKQFVLETLGHASYLIGSEQTGEAMVLDVHRDVDQYYRYAQQAGLRIGYAADTHQHNDFLTGITELRQRSTLELLAGARAELGYQARRLADGDRFTMGAKSAAFTCKKFFAFKTILPCHYGTFPDLLDPDASKFVAEMKGHNVVVPKPGEVVTV